MSASVHSAPGGPDGRVADATPANWVDRFAPQAWRPFLRLSRADRPAGVWLLLLPCWHSLALAIAAEGWTPAALWLIPAFAIGAFLMRGAGCVWNDLADHKFDAQVARTRSRPLPSGQVTKRQALGWMLLHLLLALGVLLSMNWPTIGLGVISLIPVAIYPFMKRFTWWPQVFLGIAFNWGALMGWSAATGSLGWAPILLYFSGMAWTLHYDTIYAHQDKEDDELIGVKSTARLFGARTRIWLAGFSAAAVALAGAAAMAAMEGPALAVGLAGVAAFGAHLAWQLRALDIDDAGSCLRLFRANRDSGVILLAGFAAAALL